MVALEQIQRDLRHARLATRRQAQLLGLEDYSEDEGRVSPSGESTDELTPLPNDGEARGASSPSWYPPSHTSPGLSQLMSSSADPHEEDWYFSPVHSESSGTATRTSSRWQASPASSRTTPPSQTSGSKSGGVRSPKVKNTGKVLAPHGTFTSRKAPVAAPSSMPSPSGASGSSRHSRESSRSSREVPHVVEEAEMTPEERRALEKAAKKGDQLAMYRLGWLAHRAESRHSLGQVDDVWGPTE